MKVLEEANVSIRKERDYYSMAQMIQPDPMKPDPIIRSSQSSPRAIDTKTGRRPAPPLYKGGASYALGTEVWEQHDGIWLSVREMAETNRIAAKERIELAETQEKLTDVTIRMVEQDAELDAIKLRMKDYESQRVDAVKEGKRHATELYATDISKLLELLGKGLDATEAIEEWGPILKEARAEAKTGTWTDSMRMEYEDLCDDLDEMVYPLRQRPTIEQQMMRAMMAMYSKLFQKLRDATGKVYRHH